MSTSLFRQNLCIWVQLLFATAGFIACDDTTGLESEYSDAADFEIPPPKEADTDTLPSSSNNKVVLEDSDDDDSPNDGHEHPWVIGDEWTETIAPGDTEPSLAPGNASLFIPHGIEVVRAVIVFSQHARGAEEYEHPSWRRLALMHDVAIMKIDLMEDVSWLHASELSRFVEDTFDNMARVSEHPEVAHCPILFWGHSSGASGVVMVASNMPERVLGFIGFKGSVIAQSVSYLYADQILSAQFLQVPGLMVIGEHDADHIRDTGLEMVEDGRGLGAHWGVVFEPGGIHNAVGSTHAITIPFAEALLDMRLPKEENATAGPVQLVPLPDSEGWLGAINHHRIWVEGEERGYEIIDAISIQPFERCEGNVASHNWLISEAFAKRWRDYQNVD